MFDELPILLVTHDAEDQAWQFVNGHGDTEEGMKPILCMPITSSVTSRWPSSRTYHSVGALGVPLKMLHGSLSLSRNERAERAAGLIDR